MCMLLDIVKLAKLHTGANLAAVFAAVLEDFGISNKVRSARSSYIFEGQNSPVIDPEHHL